LDSGEAFADRLTGAFSGDESARPWPQIVHVATDGETYGHHHRHGDMALAYALHLIESTGRARLTNYAEYRHRVPPQSEVAILENTAWSCAHGVDRWRADCGCASGEHPGWNQAWRAPLRISFDMLRDRLDPLYRTQAAELLRDPREAREEYLRVALDRSDARREQFLGRQSRRPLDPDERIRVWKLLEMERHLQLMYTSCGWFFDEVSGLESSQVIQYAGRAVQLAGDLGDPDAEAALVESLRKAPSNLPEIGTAATVYDRFVRPTSIDLLKVSAHYAVSSLFEAYGPRSSIDAFYVDRREEIQRQSRGGAARRVGVVGVSSAVTTES
ncbi:glycoside hydrolase family protein, partial [mine drainage metagenome]